MTEHDPKNTPVELPPDVAQLVDELRGRLPSLTPDQIAYIQSRFIQPAIAAQPAEAKSIDKDELPGLVEKWTGVIKGYKTRYLWYDLGQTEWVDKQGKFPGSDPANIYETPEDLHWRDQDRRRATSVAGNLLGVEQNYYYSKRIQRKIVHPCYLLVGGINNPSDHIGRTFGLESDQQCLIYTVPQNSQELTTDGRIWRLHLRFGFTLKPAEVPVFLADVKKVPMLIEGLLTRAVSDASSVGKCGETFRPNIEKRRPSQDLRVVDLSAISPDVFNPAESIVWGESPGITDLRFPVPVGVPVSGA